jgi:hypothetical protein
MKGMKMARNSEEVHMLSDEEWVVLEQLREARACKKEWEEQEQRCRAALLDAIGNAGSLYYGGNYVATVEDRTSKRFDRPTFKKDWPKLDEQYTKESESTFINLISDAAPEEA